MFEAIHLVSVLGIIGKSEYVSYDFDQQGLRVEITRYPFDPQAVPTDLNDIIEDGLVRYKKHVILDMGNIPWINSKGVGTLVMLYHKVKSKGGKLVMARPVPEVRELVESTSTDKVFEIFDTVNEARDHLQSLASAESKG